MIYTHVAAAAVALAVGFAGGWTTQGWRWDAADKQRMEQEAREKSRALDRANTASGTFEEKRTANETRYRTVTVTLEKVVERPVYLNQCIDDDGLRVLNEQISGNIDPGKLGLKLPKP
jgi:hypothetical protein